MRHFLLTTFTGVCPSCGEASAFAGVFQLRETCERCGVRFERWSGSWTIPTVIGYTTGFLGALILAVMLHQSRGLRSGDEFIITGAAMLGAILPYRFIKGIYVWGLWATGWVFTDDHADSPRTAR